MSIPPPDSSGAPWPPPAAEPYGPGPFPAAAPPTATTPTAPQPAPYAAGPYAPGPYAPGPYAPGQYAPGQYAPGQYAPGQYAPGQYAPGQYAPGPGQRVPGPYAAQPGDHGWYLPPGATWPMPVAARRRTDRLTAMIGWGMLALAVLTVLTSLLPWGRVHVVDLDGRAHTCGIRGWQDIHCGSFVDSYDYGTGTILFACVVGVMGVLRGLIRRAGLALAAGIVTIVMAVLTALLIAAATSVDPDPLATVTFSTSIGLWLTLVLAVAMLALGIWGTVKRR